MGMDERWDELKGQVKEGLGDLTDNARLEAEGEAQEFAPRPSDTSRAPATRSSLMPRKGPAI